MNNANKEDIRIGKLAALDTLISNLEDDCYHYYKEGLNQNQHSYMRGELQSLLDEMISRRLKCLPPA